MIRLPVIRRALAAAAIVVALLSIIPYYVLWQKSDAALAFRSFPLGSDTSMLLLDRGYLLPVPRYYLGPALPIAAMNGNVLVEVPAELYGPYVPLSCDAPEFQKITTLYVWQGPLARIQQVSKSWPACVQEKELLVFENGAWVPVNR